MRHAPRLRHEALVWLLGLVLVLLVVGGCLAIRPSRGGGQAMFRPPRTVNAADVVLPAGYRAQALVTGLTFPTGVTFDDAGKAYVVESGYSYGEVWTTPRLLRVEDGGRTSIVATGAKNGPWTGAVFHRGAFYGAEGGELEGGRILRITPDGAITALVENLPSRGDHHVNGPALGPDGWLYFGIGTYTNAGVVGEDNAKFGWLTRFPALHDVPCKDVTLAGENYTTRDAVNRTSRRVATGAFAPFGTATRAGRHPDGEAGLGPAINNKPLPGFMMKTQVRLGVGAMPRFSAEDITPDDLDAVVASVKAVRRNG